MTEHDVASLLSGADDAALFAEADRVRRDVFGQEVFLRGVVELANVCAKHCLYCGLRAPNAAPARYRLSTGDVLAAAALAKEHGMGTLVLQSGDDPALERDLVGGLVREIKTRFGLAVTLSLGDRNYEDLRHFRACGADRYLLKIETADQALHERLRPGERLKNRLVRLSWLKDLGFEVGSGIIVGLPGMDGLLLARDLLALTALNLEMLAAGPFVPHPQTPLGKAPACDVNLSLRATAVLRLLNPQANIPATSALDALDPHGRKRALRAGCNVVMPSLTPEAVRRDYSIYPGKNALAVREGIDRLKAAIQDLGLVASASPGFSPRSGPRRSHVQ